VQADIMVRTDHPAAATHAADPALPDRLRGMLGRALMEGASAEALACRPCPWQPPCALDLLFGDHGALLSGRLSMPRPFVLSVEPFPQDNDDRLTLRLSLFGFATDWAEAVAETLVRGLRGGVARWHDARLDEVWPALATLADRTYVIRSLSNAVSMRASQPGRT